MNNIQKLCKTNEIKLYFKIYFQKINQFITIWNEVDNLINQRKNLILHFSFEGEGNNFKIFSLTAKKV